MFHANPAGIINPMEKNFSFIFIEILIPCFLRTLETPIIINRNRLTLIFKSGASGARTRDLLHAIQANFQLATALIP